MQNGAMTNCDGVAPGCAIESAEVYEQPSFDTEEILSEVDEMFDCKSRGGSSMGTLFRWSYALSTAGGPNLDEPLVTDRPDFTEASSTVGEGVVQLEAGYTLTYDTADGVSVRTNSWGEPLWRIGMFADWFELRIAVFPVTERVNMANDVSDTTSGAEDLYLGAKLGLTPQEGILPEMALIPQMTVPTGSRAFSSDEVLPGLNWIYGWEINDFISTAGSTQYNRAVDEMTNGGYTEWAQSWTIAYSLSDDLGAYTEWFALFPHGADTAKPQHYFDGGFTLLLTNDIQWDIRGGVGLNSAADDYFVGTGLSIRFK